MSDDWSTNDGRDGGGDQGKGWMSIRVGRCRSRVRLNDKMEEDEKMDSGSLFQKGVITLVKKWALCRVRQLLTNNLNGCPRRLEVRDRVAKLESLLSMRSLNANMIHPLTRR